MTIKQNKIPNGWKEVQLKDIFFFKNGLNKEKKYFGIGTPIVNYVDVYKLNSFTQKDLSGKVDVTESEQERFTVATGDVFFTRTSETLKEIGFASVSLGSFKNTVFSGFILRARPKNKRLFSRYCKYCFNTQEARKEIMRKSSMTTRALTSGSSLNHVHIPLPPLPEQNRIVKVLETWDSYLEKLHEKIETKQKIKKGLMQQLLTGKKRLPGFSKNWKKVKLREIGKTYPGLTGKTKADFGAGEPYISYMNIYSNTKINTNITDFVIINTHDNQNQATFGDLFFTTSSETPNEVGISSVLLNKNINGLYLNSFCFGFRLNNFEVLSPEFSQFYFRGQQFRKAMQRIAQGASRFNLSKKYFLETEIKIPNNIEEQNAIAKILTTADEEIEKLEKQKEMVEDQKKYLLNNLITGKIRVPKND